MGSGQVAELSARVLAEARVFPLGQSGLARRTAGPPSAAPGPEAGHPHLGEEAGRAGSPGALKILLAVTPHPTAPRKP